MNVINLLMRRETLRHIIVSIQVKNPMYAHLNPVNYPLNQKDI